jgi:hypothetical protein
VDADAGVGEDAGAGESADMCEGVGVHGCHCFGAH